MDRMRAALLAAMIAATVPLAACGSSSDTGRVDSPAVSTGSGDLSATTDRSGGDASAGAGDDDATTPVASSSPASSPSPTSEVPGTSGSSASGGSDDGAEANSGGVAVEGSSPQAGSGGVSVAADDLCSSGVLAGSIVFGAGASSAGSTTARLVFRNNGSTACELSGYPGVSFVGDHGNQLGIPAVRDTSVSATTATLAPGRTASAQIRIVDAGVYDAAECRPTPSAGFRVYPPGNVGALFIRRSEQVCQGNQRMATIGPVEDR